MNEKNYFGFPFLATDDNVLFKVYMHTHLIDLLNSFVTSSSAPQVNVKIKIFHIVKRGAQCQMRHSFRHVKNYF